MDGNAIWNTPTEITASNEPAVPFFGEMFEPKLQRLVEWGYPAEVLSPAELKAIHPDLKPQDGVEQIAYFPMEGYVDVPHLVAKLASAARAHGAEIRSNQKVVEILQEAGCVVGVKTATGEHHSADVVVSCTGRWTDFTTELVGAPIPLAPTLGLLVTSTPVPTTLRSLVHTTSVNLRPDGGSRVKMASFDHDALLDWDTPRQKLREYAEEVLDRAKVILPVLDGGSVDSYKVGIRALSQDGLPAIGPVSGLDGFYMIVTHSGVTMGPFLGRIAAKEILGGPVDNRLTDFRPDRFLVTANSVA
jgi:glycine/D-amino acid oxidase-like deaminating enzyme